MLVKNMKTILDSNKYDNCECNFKLKSKPGQPPEWFNQWVNGAFIPFAQMVANRLDKIDEFIVEQKKFNKKQEQFNQYVLDKIQNIENVLDKNNLK